jgi:hypothetical protein
MFDYWFNQYISRGFVPGGMFNKQNVYYIPIPKNSSSYIGKLLLANDWGISNFLKTELIEQQVIIVLRDPIKRWISGMAQYLCSTGYPADDTIKKWNSLTTTLVFDRIIFDDHTEKQTYFITGVPTQSCVYFNSEHGVVEHIQRYLISQNIDLNMVGVELGDNTQHAKLSKFLNNLLDNQPYLIDRLKEVYADDYKLIESVKFYD